MNEPSPTPSPVLAATTPISLTTARPPTTPALQPTPRPLNFYPLGKRTGLVGVDTVIEAVERRDVTGLNRLARFYSLPCTEPGIGAVVCPTGEPLGAAVTVIGSGSCEPRFSEPGSEYTGTIADRFVNSTRPLDPRLYAITPKTRKVQEAVPGLYEITFASGHWLIVDDSGITYFGFICNVNPADGVDPKGPFHLPPA